MSKILFLGYIPPAVSGGKKIEAANYRTWQLLTPLLEDNNTIFFCANEKSSNLTVDLLVHDFQQGLTIRTIDFSQIGWQRKLQKIHDDFKPDCIVAVNFDMCLYTSKLSTKKPVWMDIYGDPLTIMQASFYRSRSNRGLTTTLVFMNHVLTKGDKFSVCSITQEHMLVGEIAMTGRLNGNSFGYRFAEVILPGAVSKPATSTPDRDRAFLKKHGVEQSDFVALWCGGYNTWTDIETLFSALELAMDKNPQFHYVSVGANTYDSPDNVYTRLLEKIKQSPNRNRYHMLGWRPWNEMVDYYRESDVGLNIDAMHYETIYGTRTRLLEMMASGLPVLTSLGSELSYYLKNEQACLSFSIGDWRGLCDSMLLLAQNPEMRKELSARANRLIENELSFESTTMPLRTWVKQPEKAPDSFVTRSDRMFNIINLGRSILRQVIWNMSGLSK